MAEALAGQRESRPGQEGGGKNRHIPLQLRKPWGEDYNITYHPKEATFDSEGGAMSHHIMMSIKWANQGMWLPLPIFFPQSRKGIIKIMTYHGKFSRANCGFVWKN